MKRKAAKGDDYFCKVLIAVCYAILVCSAVGALWAMTRGLDKPLLGPHSFRQTHTALSAYYMAGEPAMFLNYVTPVLGKPWQIPMEVPFFQWIVARFHNVSGINLDSSGRLVSIGMWFLCLIPAWWICVQLRFSLPSKLLTLSLFLSSPLFLFWGQSFLIETTGTFLSMMMVALALRGVSSKSYWLVGIALAFGVAAALCKATTWAVAAGVAILLILFRNGLPKLKEWQWTGVGLLAACLPIVPAKIWLAWGDAVKVANPFAREIILAGSPKQAAWNFGTLDQKLDPAVWGHIWQHITEGLLVPLPVVGPFLLPLVLIVGAAMSPNRIPIILIFLAGFAAGPIIFTNLYFEHSYYWCANGVWLLLALGCALTGIWEYQPKVAWPKVLAVSLTASIAIYGFLTWHARFLPILNALPSQEELAEAWTNPVQKLVPEQRTLLIIGNDWNPNSLHYAQRKGIAFPTAPWIPLPGPQLDESLSLLGSEDAIGAVVINDAMLTPENSAFFSSFLQKLGMSENGIRTPFGIVFQALDLKFGGIPAGE